MAQLQRDKILVVSRDRRLADVRKRLLENAGFTVISANAENAAEEARKCEGVRLIMLGYSLPPSDKRRVWVAAKAHCKVPILELYQSGKPELLEQNVLAYQAKQPDDFLESVRKRINQVTPQPQALICQRTAVVRAHSPRRHGDTGSRAEKNKTTKQRKQPRTPTKSIR